MCADGLGKPSVKPVPKENGAAETKERQVRPTRDADAILSLHMFYEIPQLSRRESACVLGQCSLEDALLNAIRL